TSLCQCVGVTSSALGDGVGPLQGEYGLGLDQIVSARLVLADGTAPDLLWALKGAGQNFGIVTEMKLRVYENKGKEDWALVVLIFSQDKPEDVFEALNKKLPGQPNHLSYDFLLAMASILCWLAPNFSGYPHSSFLFQRFQPGRDLLASFHGNSPNALSRRHRSTSVRVDISHLHSWPLRGSPWYRCQKVRAVRHAQLLNLFNEATRAVPEFGVSYAFIESYATQAVRAIPAKSAAFARRHLNTLITDVLMYDAPSQNLALDKLAHEWGEKIHSAVLEHQERQESYDYSVKQESLEAMYG
ncbi:hypothetical protein B0T25DRAFT_594982, partial [Lasiosphaeria hispida]